MPAPPPNYGQLMGADNTGPQANVTAFSSVPGSHTPAGTLTASGGLTISTPQTITKKLITGNVTNTATGTIIEDCEIRGRVSNATRSRREATLRLNYCKITGFYGATGGLDGTGVGDGNVVLYRCEIACFKDLLQINFLGYTMVECWIHSPWDTEDDFFADNSAHPDPIQFNIVYAENTDPDYQLKDFLVQSCRFDSWPYLTNEVGGPDGDGWEQLSGHGSATSGFFIMNGNNTSGGANILGPARGTFRDNYIDGRYDNGFYIAKSGVTTSAVPTNIRVFDNIFKKRTAAWGFGGGSSSNKLASVQSAVTWTWGRNLDADTGLAISVNGGTQLSPGPGSDYPTWYDGSTEPPPAPVDPPAPEHLGLGTPYIIATRATPGTPGAPASIVTGNLCYLIQESSCYGPSAVPPTLVTPPGWSPVLERTANDAVNTRVNRLRIDRRQMTGGADDNPSVQMANDGSGNEYGYIARKLGLYNTGRDGNPVDAFVSFDLDSTSAINTVTGVTTTGPERLIHVILAGADDNTFGTFKINGVDMVLRTISTDQATTVGSDLSIAVASAPFPTAGATGAITAVGSGADTVALAIIATRPPPIITNQAPFSEETDVSATENVVVTFSETMLPASITTSTFTLTPTAGGSAVAATVTMSGSDKIATLNPTASLTAGAEYRVELTNGIDDVAGNTFSGAAWTFTVAGGAGAVPSEIADPVISEPSPGTIRAAFTAPSTVGTNAYAIRYGAGEDFAFTDVTSGLQFKATTACTPGESITAELAGFSLENEDYSFRLFARNADLVWNDGVSVNYTTEDLTAPGEVTGLAVTSPSEGSLRVAFTMPTSTDASSYIVRWGTATLTDETSGNSFALRTTATPGQAVVLNLAGFSVEDVTYYVKAFAGDEVPNWSAGSEVNITLVPLVAPPPASTVARRGGGGSVTSTSGSTR